MRRRALHAVQSAVREQFRIHIRWMIRRDMPEVLQIERSSFDYPWTEDDFFNCLRQRNRIGMVAEHDEQIIGFMVYKLHKTKLDLLNFAVHPDFRRRGVGRAMTAKLDQKLSWDRRSRIIVAVRERNLPAQHFFKAMNFQAVRVERNYFDDPDEDAYILVFTCREAQERSRFSPRNRISQYFPS